MAEKEYLAEGGGNDWKGGKQKGKSKGKNKGYGKKGVYGVDYEDDAWEGDPVAWAAAAASDAEWAKDGKRCAMKFTSESVSIYAYK